MNIFLRDVAYNRLLTNFYRLASLEPWLELPMDSNTYQGLADDSQKFGLKSLTKWSGVKRVTKPLNETFQQRAQQIAERLQSNPVHLDVRYWRKGAVDSLVAKRPQE